jgi:hypothetical protein
LDYYIISFSSIEEVVTDWVNFKHAIDMDSKVGTFCVHRYVERLAALPNFDRQTLCFSFGRPIRFSCQRRSRQDDR